MVTKIISWIENIINSGATFNDSFKNRQINFANAVYLISICIISCYIIFYAIYDFMLFLPIIIFDIFVNITIIFAFFLNLNGQFRVSKIFFCFVANIFLTFLSVHYGQQTGFHVFFFLFMAYTVIVYDYDSQPEKYIGLFWIVVSFVLFLYIEIYFIYEVPLHEGLPEELIRYLYVFSITTGFASLVYLLYILMKNVKRKLYEK